MAVVRGCLLYTSFYQLGAFFSIWDPVAHGDNPNDVPEEERTKLVKLGKDARSGRFGGEGTGGHSFVDYPWAIGENMRFLVAVYKRKVLAFCRLTLLKSQFRLPKGT